MKKVFLVLASTALPFLGGCASILNEPTQNINVSTSNNEKVEVMVDGETFVAPGVVSVLRQNQDKVIVAKSGNCANETALNKEVDGKFFINILSGGALGSTTDYSTEKMWKYQDAVEISCQ